MKGLSAEEYSSLLRSVGTHRGKRLLSPVEVARLLKKSIDSGGSRQECAEALSVGPTQISAFLKLLILAPQIQHLADWRGSSSASVSFSSLAELARLPEHDHVSAADAILKHGLTWKETVQLVQLADRSAGDLNSCLDQVLSLRPQIETRHLFVGAIPIEDVKRQLGCFSQSDRDSLLSKTLDSMLGTKDLVECRLGEDSFTIISDQNLPALLGIDADRFEADVLDALRSRLSRRDEIPN